MTIEEHFKEKEREKSITGSLYLQQNIIEQTSWLVLWINKASCFVLHFFSSWLFLFHLFIQLFFLVTLSSFFTSQLFYIQFSWICNKFWKSSNFYIWVLLFLIADTIFDAETLTGRHLLQAKKGSSFSLSFFFYAFGSTYLFVFFIVFSSSQIHNIKFCFFLFWFILHLVVVIVTSIIANFF